LRREKVLQNSVSTDEDLGGSMKVEPEGRRQRKSRSGTGLETIRTIRKSLDGEENINANFGFESTTV
jgi:hypothetical protein